MEAAASLLELAVATARSAGELLLARFQEASWEPDAAAMPRLAASADMEAEGLIGTMLATVRPADGILAEEGTRRPSASGLTWLVDPLDGTANFLRASPHWAVSVAVEDEAGPLAAAVYDPVRGETFSAMRGGGAFLDGQPLEGPPQRPLAHAAVTGDFAAPAVPGRDRAGELAACLLRAAGHVRVLGSAALDLCWVAAGRCDGFYHEHAPKPWDLAAGRLVCEESGLRFEVLDPLGPGMSPRALAGRPELVLALETVTAGALLSAPTVTL